jgi:carboxyl-terminal processing protease
MKHLKYLQKFPMKKITLSALALTVGMATTLREDHGKMFEISKNIEIFTSLYKELNMYYVDDVDPSKLMRTGVDAMMSSLDPYTNYISESDIEGYRYITEGKYSGIGVSFQKAGEWLFVESVFEGSPAQKAGLKVGDKITTVDGKSAKGRDLDELDEILKGTAGTDVELGVLRPQLNTIDKDLKIKVVRDEITEHNVPYFSMLNENVGYVVLTTFSRDAGQNVANAFKELKSKNPNMKGLIFDLRGNGGGLLHEAVNICNIWLPKDDTIVSTRGKVIEWDRGYRTLNQPIDEQMPIVVLVDKFTASASEIVSGALQDYDRAVIMGQRTYGKGLVQNVRDIGYNSKLKLTTSKYYIPSGRCIQAVRYEKGKPVEIPDAERERRYTRSGRPVLGGGGIKPDVLLNKNDDFGLMKTLKDKFYLFDYVTQYCLKNPSIAEPEKFHYTEFDDFVNFLEKRGFQYDSESEKLVKQLEDNAAKEKYLSAIQSELTLVKSKIQSDKKNDLMKHKAELEREIEREIVERYYFHKGQIKISLRNDPDVTEAVKILDNTTRYKSILKK